MKVILKMWVPNIHSYAATTLLVIVAYLLCANSAIAQEPAPESGQIMPVLVVEWENVSVRSLVSGISHLLRSREMDTQCVLEAYKIEDNPGFGVFFVSDDHQAAPVVTLRLYSFDLLANSIDELVDQLQQQVPDFVWRYHRSCNVLSVIARDITGNPDWALNRVVNVEVDIESDAYTIIDRKEDSVVRLPVCESRTAIYYYINEISHCQTYWLLSPLTKGSVLERSSGLRMPNFDTEREKWDRWLVSRRAFYTHKESYDIDLGVCSTRELNSFPPSDNTIPHP